MEGRKRERERDSMTIVHCVCARVWIDLAYTTQSPSRRGEGIHFVSSWPGSRKIKRFLFWPLLLLVSFHSIYIERDVDRKKKELPSDFVTFLLFNSRHIS